MSSLGDRLVGPTVSCTHKHAVMDSSFLFVDKIPRGDPGKQIASESEIK